MSIPTVIRHTELEDGFICVITTLSPFTARVQQYNTHGHDGRTSLVQEWAYGSEKGAIKEYEKILGIE